MAAPALDDETMVHGFDLRALVSELYRALRRLPPVHPLPDGTRFLTRHAGQGRAGGDG